MQGTVCYVYVGGEFLHRAEGTFMSTSIETHNWLRDSELTEVVLVYINQRWKPFMSTTYQERYKRDENGVWVSYELE